MSLGRRTVPQFPDHTIDLDGVVRDHRGQMVPRIAKNGPYGVNHLAVRIDGNDLVLWRLISHFWHEGKLLFPRDGSFLNLRNSNMIALSEFSSQRITDAAVVHGIWRHHRADGLTTRQIIDRMELLNNTPDEVKSVIADILVASIR